MRERLTFKKSGAKNAQMAQSRESELRMELAEKVFG